MVFFIIPPVQLDVDALVEIARGHLDTGSGELGAELVETTGGDALLGAINVVC